MGACWLSSSSLLAPSITAGGDRRSLEASPCWWELAAGILEETHIHYICDGRKRHAYTLYVMAARDIYVMVARDMHTICDGHKRHADTLYVMATRDMHTLYM